MEGLNGKGKKRFEHWPVVAVGLAVYDALAVNFAYFLALWLRYDCQFSAIPEDSLRWLGRFAPLYTPVCLAIFWLCRMYRDRWRHAGDRELLQAVLAVCLACAAQIVGVWVLFGRMPVAYYAVGALLQLLAVLLPRLVYRLVWGIFHPEKAAPAALSMEALLDRPPVDMAGDLSYLHGKTVLVTGGGGSIGGALCRQIAAQNPQKLIIFDVYENNAFLLQQELKERDPQLDVVARIGSVRDKERLEQIFSQYRPQVVFHAAAHKHVPLMEENPWEAVKNNVLGTYRTAYAAMENGCRLFFLISTDKAVDPAGVMGATKRLCERLVLAFDRKLREGRPQDLPRLSGARRGGDPAETTQPEEIPVFAAVRLGNVLGSGGSVVPTFQRQIAQGGPVTVTDPEATRYFMTPLEAVRLTLQAAACARGGEIFVPDLGEPVKIDDLARKLIRLSGLQPEKDIPITYTGLRPGEKLREASMMDLEGLRSTDDPKLFLCPPEDFNVDYLLSRLPALKAAAEKGSGDALDWLTRLEADCRPGAQVAKGAARKPSSRRKRRKTDSGAEQQQE